MGSNRRLSGCSSSPISTREEEPLAGERCERTLKRTSNLQLCTASQNSSLSSEHTVQEVKGRQRVSHIPLSISSFPAGNHLKQHGNRKTLINSSGGKKKKKEKKSVSKRKCLSGGFSILWQQITQSSWGEGGRGKEERGKQMPQSLPVRSHDDRKQGRDVGPAARR